jgi:hypothetical protein
MELHNLYSSPNTVRVMRAKKDEARMGESGNMYMVLAIKCEVKRTLGRPRY